jgi:hypothetical protein
MRPCIERSNDLATLSPFRSWLDCTINTSGYDFPKGQPLLPPTAVFRRENREFRLARRRRLSKFTGEEPTRPGAAAMSTPIAI